MGGFVGKVISTVAKASKFFGNMNPLVSLGITLFISWALRPKTPEIPDFGTNEFDDFEKGILLNKQSNDSNIPVIYGERLTGGTRVFMETSGTDNTYLYMAIVMAEGEINSIEEIRVDADHISTKIDVLDTISATLERIEDLDETRNAKLGNIETSTANLVGINKVRYVYDNYRSLNVPGYATGGEVRGAGTGTSDSIPAKLSNGEFVIKVSEIMALKKSEYHWHNEKKIYEVDISYKKEEFIFTQGISFVDKDERDATYEELKSLLI